MLLIGKYPPCQGGIASKAYWLTCAMDKRGIEVDVVTWVPDVARSHQPGNLPTSVRLAQLPTEEPPWHLPGTDLAVERLVAAALEMAETRRPSLVEANYLAPYGTAALIVARTLDIPLLLRHAGSDVAKLGTWEPTRRALKTLIHSADAVVTALDSSTELLSGMPKEIRLLNLSRYVPAPDAFRSHSLPFSVPTILVAGKLNYHWRLKAIDTLFDALVENQGWCLLVVGDGRGADAVRSEIERRSMSSRVEWRDFVPPSEMPLLLSQVQAVWAVERRGGVDDFSNIVAEAILSGRACFVAHHTLLKADFGILAGSAGLVVVDPDAVGQVAACLGDIQGGAGFPAPDLEKSYESYVDANIDLYADLISAGRSRPRAVE